MTGWVSKTQMGFLVRFLGDPNGPSGDSRVSGAKWIFKAKRVYGASHGHEGPHMAKVGAEEMQMGESLGSNGSSWPHLATKGQT